MLTVAEKPGWILPGVLKVPVPDGTKEDFYDDGGGGGVPRSNEKDLGCDYAHADSGFGEINYSPLNC